MLWVQCLCQLRPTVKEKRFTEDTKPCTEQKIHMRFICYDVPTFESAFGVKHFGTRMKSFILSDDICSQRGCILVVREPGKRQIQYSLVMMMMVIKLDLCTRHLGTQERNPLYHLGRAGKLDKAGAI